MSTVPSDCLRAAISCSSRQAAASGRSNDGIRQLTADEVRQALQAARSGAATAAVNPRQPSLSSSSARVSYAPVFHPGVTDIRAAATIALGVSEERSGVDVTIQLVPTATVSGTISAPAGAVPQFLSVRLVPAGAETELLAGAGLRGLVTQPRSDGTYVFAGVAPGAYTIKADHRKRTRCARPTRRRSGPRPT